MLRTIIPSLSDTLRLRASIFFRSELSTPWGLALAQTADLRFHFVTQGSCWLGGAGLRAPKQLQPGEIILITGSQESWLADTPGRALLPSDDAANSCRLGQPPFQEGPTTHRLVCGQAQIHDQGGGWLLLLLPDVLHVRRTDVGDRVWQIVEAIAAPSSPLIEDDAQVLDRLAEALFLSLLGRATELEFEDGRLGIGYRDPTMRRVLELIHTRLDEPWTIQRLAEQALTSRATLARRFKATLGCSVMGYLTQVRMALASRLLFEGADLTAVSQSTGYESAETFRKAFKRHMGVTPASYLRERGARPDAG